MDTKKAFALAILFLAFAAVLGACTQSTSTPQSQQAQVQTAVAATLTAAAPQTASHTLTVQEMAATAVAATLTASAPTQAPKPSPTPKPTNTPTPAAPPVSGVWVAGDNAAAFYQFPNGKPHPVVSAAMPPGAISLDPHYAQILGTHDRYVWVYLAKNELRTKPVYIPNTIFAIYDHFNSQRILGMILGAAGGNLFAYSAYTPKPNGADSELILGKYDLQAGNQLVPSKVLSIHDDKGYVLRPYAFQFAPSGSLQALWVTLELTGIGDAPISPRRGLWRVDLSTNKAAQVIAPAQAKFKGISPDGKLVAVVPAQGKGLHWGTVASPTAHAVPPLGNGAITQATFSPSNRWLAWSEVSGSFDSGYTYHLRVLDTTTGKVVVNDQPSLGIPQVWLTGDLLLLQSWSDKGASISIWSLKSKTLVATIHGEFISAER